MGIGIFLRNIYLMITVNFKQLSTLANIGKIEEWDQTLGGTLNMKRRFSTGEKGGDT